MTEPREDIAMELARKIDSAWDEVWANTSRSDIPTPEGRKWFGYGYRAAAAQPRDPADESKSRERCDEQFATDFIEVFGGFPKDQAIAMLVRRQREVKEAAERDTRERCAQQGRSLLELVLDVTLKDSSKKNEILDTFERRIRGEE